MNLEAAVGDESRISGCDLSGGSAAGIDLRRAVLSETSLSEADLSGAQLDEADLSGLILNKIKLDQASLKGALLTGASLEESSLVAADLSGADLGDVSCVGLEPFDQARPHIRAHVGAGSARRTALSNSGRHCCSFAGRSSMPFA